MAIHRSHTPFGRLNLITLLLLVTAACGQAPSNAAASPVAMTPTTYRVLDRSLAALKADFNAHRGQVRLLFVVGPTCGVCLSGMDQLNEKLVAAHQADARLATLVVHVPALQAEEKHVPAAIELMHGPRVSHYWDPMGTTGRRYQEVLALDVYAWDVWLVYGPAAVWDGDLPPAPAFWRHQLPRGVDKVPRLDAKEFAAEVGRRLATLPARAASRHD